VTRAGTSCRSSSASRPAISLLLDRAFRQDHDVDGTGLVSGCGERPVGEIKVEPFRRSELEKAEGVVGEPLQRPGYGAEI